MPELSHILGTLSAFGDHGLLVSWAYCELDMSIVWRMMLQQRSLGNDSTSAIHVPGATKSIPWSFCHILSNRSEFWSKILRIYLSPVYNHVTVPEGISLAARRTKRATEIARPDVARPDNADQIKSELLEHDIAMVVRIFS